VPALQYEQGRKGGGVRRSIHAPSRQDRRKAFNSRAWLNGVEVTSDCQVADDRLGCVLVLKRNEDGNHYADGNSVAKEWRHGRVEIGRK
jgi:hypothetical protein